MARWFRHAATASAVAWLTVLSAGGAFGQALIEGDLSRFMPAAEALAGSYAVVMQLPRPNNQVRRDWGEDAYQICIATGRADGYLRIYNLKAAGAAGAPAHFVLLVERFETVAGAEEFWNYDFTGAFRAYARQAHPIALSGPPKEDLSAADAARLSEFNGGGDTPFAHEKYLEYRYRNVQVLVGAAGDRPFETAPMRQLAAMVLQALAAE